MVERFSFPVGRRELRACAVRLALSGLVAGVGTAGAQDFHVRHYTLDDGLPSTQIQDAAQDELGRMWFATRSGVAAYDGSEWSVYNLAHGLTWADTFALRWDGAGVLWSIGSVRPFKVFSFEQGRWRAFPEPSTLPGSQITAFAVLGEGAGRTLAVGTDRGLLLSRGGEWRRVTRADGLPADEVTALAVHRGRLVAATPAGLAEVRAGRPGAAPDLDPAPFQSVPEARRRVTGLVAEAPAPPASSRLWILGEDWIAVLEDERFVLLEEDLPPAPAPARWLAVADRRGGLFLGHGGAFYHFHPLGGLGVWDTRLLPLGRDDGLAADGVSALFLDREDDLWVGSRRGLAKIPNRRFVTYNRRHGLLDDEVTAVLERRDGVVLAHPRGISRVSAAGVATLDLTRRRPDLVRRNVRVRDLAADRDGNLWLPVDSAGLARVDAAGQVAWLGEGEGLRGAASSVLVEPASGRLWVGTTDGLYARRRDGRFERTSAAPPRLHVRRIFSGPAGDLLLATSSGLHRYSAAGWRAARCAGGGACDSVFAVLATADGFWVGTAAGLYRTAGEGLARERAPAIERPVYFIVRDAQGRAWFGIDNGVLRWDGEALEHFTVKDGLAGRETNRAAGLVDARGRVWIGTEGGATVHVETRPGPPRAPAVVTLTGLEAGGERLALDEPQRLGYRANDVVFRYRAVSFVDEDSVRVSWRLEGFDADWLPPQASANREIRYTNLAPGTYRLHLRVMNAEGAWSEEVTSAALAVARPYWQQPWFFLVAAAVAGAALLLFQRHLAQKRYARRLEIEVEERMEQLRKVEGELAKSQRLEALGLLAGGIAHDFNNFLTVLLGNLSLLSIAGRSEAQRAEDLDDARGAVLRASKLTQQLLTFSRGGAPVRRAAAVTEVIADSASFVLSGSKVKCELALPPDLRVVEIDADQIHQLLNNLLINAIQAMPGGGTVRIAARNVDRAPAPLPAGRYVAIAVADQGPGIPEELQERIFDPYFTTKRDGKGIGLASAYSIAKRHDGLLTVDSRPGEGATFTLYLPASWSRIVEPEPSGAVLAPGAGRALVMDDEEPVRKVTGAMAEDLGYEVDYAADGDEAVARYRRAMDERRPFDVVIMDLTIPGGMGGQETIRQLLDLDPEVRAIVMSGYSNDPVLANHRDYGFQGRLSKPFRVTDLTRVLARLGHAASAMTSAPLVDSR